MRSLLKARSLRIAGLSLGAVAVAGAAIAITASAAGVSFNLRTTGSAPPAGAGPTAAESAASSTACTDFMKHFAVEIGKTQAQINSSFQKAIADTLADEVKSGQLTQAQADALKKKLAGQTPCTLPTKTGTSPKAGIAAYMQQYLAAAASALGITQAQLTADVKAGQSLSQVAVTQHVSEADFRTKVVANLKPALDQAATNKTITAAQEQTLLKNLQTGPLPLWNLPAKRVKPTPTPTSATT